MSDIQSISQNNYILQAPPPSSTMSTTALEYDADNKISGYAGSAFAGGVPSAASGYWQDASDVVNSSSGAWGGSALPISAGPGVSAGLVNGTLVFRNDETVLWEADSPSAFYNISPIQLSDDISAFERIKIIENPWPDNPVKYVHEFVPNNNLYYSILDSWIASTADYTNPWTMMNMMTFSAGDKCQYLSDLKCRYNATAVSGPDHSMRIYKIIGINRKQ